MSKARDTAELNNGIDVDASGNVGIGTSSPQRALSIGTHGSSGAAEIAFGTSTTGNASLLFGDGTTGTALYDGYIQYQHNGGNMLFATGGGSERMRIDSSGRVGIGTSSPTNTSGLEIQTSSTTAGLWVQTGGTTSSYNIAEFRTGSNLDALKIRGDGSSIFQGNVGIGTTAPQGNLDIDVTNVTSLGLRTNTGIIVAQYTGAPAVGNRSQIGLGYGNTYTNVSLGAVRTSAAAYGTDDFIIATKSGTGDTAPTERMRIDSSGNVGIGTSSPLKQLSLQNASNAEISLISSTSGVCSVLMGDGTTGTDYYKGYIQYNNSSDSMLFATSADTKMRIDSSGRLLVNRTSEISGGRAERLQVSGTPGAYAAIATEMSATTAQDHITFHNPNGVVGAIQTSGSSTTYATSSDYRLKENVVELTGATDRLKQLNPSRFNFIADADTTVDGFLAHEVQAVVPEAITGTKDAVDADGNPEYQGIDQSKLVPLLVATIKELEARITALENA